MGSIKAGTDVPAFLFPLSLTKIKYIFCTKLSFNFLESVTEIGYNKKVVKL